MFTFISCTYNHEQFILMHLESIKYQIIHNFSGIKVSLIIADDGSKDSTVYLCNEWIAKNRALFDHTEVIGDGINRGTCKNLILALQHLKTDLFFLLAGDDVYGYRSIMEVAGNLDRYDLVSAPCPAFYQDSNEGFKIEVNYEIYKTNIAKGLSHPFFRHALTITGCLVEAAPAIYRNKLLDKEVMEFISRYRLIEDQPMIYKFFKNNKIKFKYLDYSYVLYRMNPESVSHTNNDTIKAFAKADLESLCNYYLTHEKNPILKYTAFIRKKSLNRHSRFAVFYPTYLYLVVKQNILNKRVKYYYKTAIGTEQERMVEHLLEIQRNVTSFKDGLLRVDMGN